MEIPGQSYNSMGNTGWFGSTSPWNYSPGTFGDTETSGGYSPFSWDSYAQDPSFLKLIGYSGDAFLPQNIGDSGGEAPQLSPDFLEKANQFEIRKMTGENWGGTLSSIFKNNREVSPSFRQRTLYDEGPGWNLAHGLASAAIAPGGFIAGPTSGIGGSLGFTGNAATGLNAAFNSGLISAGSGAEDKDIAKGMALSGGAAFLPNLGEMAGINNPYLANAFDGAVKGGAVADMTDNDVKTGAVMGGIPGLASYFGGRFGDTSYVPTTSGQNLLNETNNRSGIQRPTNFNFTDSPGMSMAPQYVPQGSPFAFNSSARQADAEALRGEGGFELPELNNFFSKLTPNSPEQWGNFAEGLGGLLMGGMQYRKARKLEKEMGTRRGAYETNLRRQLERRDAASGRRSNYSGRETALQASLAELDSRNMPAMSALQTNQLGGLASMFTSGLRYAGKQGAFGERFMPGYREPSQAPISSYLMSTIPRTTDVNNFDQFIGNTRFGDQTDRRFRLGGM